MSTRKRKTWNRGTKPASEIRAAGDFRKQFAPIAEKHRRFSRLLGLFCLAALAAMPAAWLVPPLRNAMMMLGLLFAIAAFVFAGGIPRLVCPACRKSLTPKVSDFGPYCPRCRGTNLNSGSWLSGSACGDCGAVFGYNKGGKTFTVHACTHCGVWLDDEGV